MNNQHTSCQLSPYKIYKWPPNNNVLLRINYNKKKDLELSAKIYFASHKNSTCKQNNQQPGALFINIPLTCFSIYLTTTVSTHSSHINFPTVSSPYVAVYMEFYCTIQLREHWQCPWHSVSFITIHCNLQNRLQITINTNIFLIT